MRASDADPTVRAKLAAIFACQTRAHWQQVFAHSDACVSPVLSIDEAADHPQNLAWGSLRRVDGMTLPRAAPRFSRTPTAASPASSAGAGRSQWRLDGLDPALE